jgi:hypothetical protein
MGCTNAKIITAIGFYICADRLYGGCFGALFSSQIGTDQVSREWNPEPWRLRVGPFPLDGSANDAIQ